MSDIDDKLKEYLLESLVILEANRDVGPRRWEIALELFLNDVLPQVHKAFTDAGYMYAPQVRLTGSVPQWIENQHGERMCTGQEWLHRFEKELDKHWDKGFIADDDGKEGLPKLEIIELAKRAAGIE